MFTLFTTQNCAYCNKLKKFFGDRNIQYEAVDITEDRERQKELHAKYNALTVPVLVKDNGDYMVGLNMPKLMSMVK